MDKNKRISLILLVVVELVIVLGLSLVAGLLYKLLTGIAVGMLGGALLVFASIGIILLVYANCVFIKQQLNNR